MRFTTPRFWFALAMAASMATAAQAQVSPDRGPTQPGPAAPSVQLNMDDQHVLKEGLLKDAKVKPEATEVELEPGTKVPAAVQLHSFPDVIAGKIPKLKSHEYFIAGEAVVIVEPQQRTIVEVVK